jgi:hypothetical protein
VNNYYKRKIEDRVPEDSVEIENINAVRKRNLQRK